MAFQKPTLEDLFKLADTLLEKYSGTNSQRFSFIALLKQATDAARKGRMTPQKAHDLLFNLLVLEYEAINSSEYNRHWYSVFSPSGSEIFGLIRDGLKINEENQLSPFEILPSLYETKEYIQKVYSDQDFAELKQDAKKDELKLVWETRDELIKFVDYAMKNHYERYKRNVENLKKSERELERLRKISDSWSATYLEEVDKKNKKAWIKKHVPKPFLAETMSLLAEACHELFKPNPDDPDDESRAYEAMAHRGIHLFRVLESYNSYSVGSPEGGLLYDGSASYKLSKTAFKKDPLQYSIDDQKKMLEALQHLIKKINNSRYFLNKKTQEWDLAYTAKHGKGKLQKVLNELNSNVTKLMNSIEAQSKQASLKGMVVSASVGYSAQAVGKRAVENGATAAIEYIATTTLGVGGIAAGPIGIGVSTGAALLVFGAGYFLRHTVAGRVIIGAGAAGVDVLSGAIGDRAADLLSGLGDAKDGIYSLRQEFKPEDDIVFCKWVNTLLKLSDKLVSEKTKNEIRETFDLKPAEELKPLIRVAYTPGVLFKGDKNLQVDITKDYNPVAAAEEEQFRKDAAAAEDHPILCKPT